MAKNADTNPLENHIEKIILGICSLALIVVVAHWVVSSPRTVEVIDPLSLTSGTPVPPSQVDEALSQAAKRVKDRNQTAKAPPMPTLDWTRRFAEVSGQPFPPIAVLDGGRPSLPILRQKPVDPNALPNLPDLASLVPAPSRPVDWHGFEVRKTAEGTTADEIVYHGAGVYPWGDLHKRWDERLRRLPLPFGSIVVQRVEVQVQTRSPEGQYSGQDGKPAPLVSLPPVDSDGRTLRMPQIPSFDGNNREAIQAAIAELAAPNWQRYILTPPYYNVFNAKAGYISWRIHLPDNDVSKLETSLLIPPTPGPAAPVAPVAPVVPGPMPPGRGYGPGVGPGMRGPGAGMGPGARGPGPGMGPAAGGPPAGGMGPGAGGYGPGVAPGAGYPSTPAATPAPDLSSVGPVLTDGPAPATVKMNPIPPLARQQQDGLELAVFHDNTLKIGTYYRYRYRLVLVNPLLGQDAVQNKARDSYQKEIPSPWSEWGEECVIENPTRFFVIGTFPPNRLQVAVFTQKMGQTVKQVFNNVEPGMAIGGVAKVSVASPTGGNQMMDVDFSTGCVAVETDLSRPYVRSGAALPAQTSALLYLDEKGRLRWRIQVEDQNSAEYKRYQAEMGAAP